MEVTSTGLDKGVRILGVKLKGPARWLKGTARLILLDPSDVYAALAMSKASRAILPSDAKKQARLKPTGLQG